jgi:EAL domain-containing protein (putative c-di-GMP-specific phosphodiesterase class I)
VGFEILGRSGIFGLESPAAMFRAASYLNMEAALSRALRLSGVEASLTAGLDVAAHVFLNTHPAELDEDELIDSLRALRKLSPHQAITLEIHEEACTRPAQMKDLRTEFQQLQISLAYDDFGAGQTRLRELVEVPPDYLKFDIDLLHNIDQAPAAHQQMVATLVRMVHELNIAAIAEGIENEHEARVCRDLGFDFAQGYYFGRPVSAACLTTDLSPAMPTDLFPARAADLSPARAPSNAQE